MSRFLFVLADAGGNVPPQLAIARRLAARGHAVHVLADRVLRADVERAGAVFEDYRQAPQHHMRDTAADRVRDWEAWTPPGQLRRIGTQLMFGPAEAYAADVQDAVARLGPDAVAVDCLLFGAMAAAEASGLPAAVLFHYPFHAPVPGLTPLGFGLTPAQGALGRWRDRAVLALTRRVFAFGRAPLNAARGRLGLPPLADVLEQLLRLPRGLVLTSRAFDFVPSGLPAHVTYVGPQLDDPSWPEPWVSPWPDEARMPLVLVSLGSTYQRQEPALARVVDALARLPVRGLVTLGGAPPLARPLPANVHVVASAPHRAVLPHCAAVVCHGGHGTVMKALAHGLPLVVVPFGRDQHDNGARVRVAGAGLVVSPTTNAGHLAATIERVLTEPTWRRGAEALAAAIAQDVRDDPAAHALEALANRDARGYSGRS